MADFELNDEVKSLTFPQDYTPQTKIEGIKMLDIRRYLTDEGDFAEVMRFNENGGLEIMPDFKVRQINRTHLFSGSIKAWHFHYKQDEIWYVAPNDQITVGIWDLRKDSPTSGVKYKVTLGSDFSRALFIPKGVAHGSANYMDRSINLFYFVSQTFNLAQADEHRLHWDAAGADFWKPERD